jgi:hypothetical protein
MGGRRYFASTQATMAGLVAWSAAALAPVNWAGEFAFNLGKDHQIPNLHQVVLNTFPTN